MSAAVPARTDSDCYRVVLAVRRPSATVLVLGWSRSPEVLWRRMGPDAQDDSLRRGSPQITRSHSRRLASPLAVVSAICDSIPNDKSLLNRQLSQRILSMSRFSVGCVVIGDAYLE